MKGRTISKERDFSQHHQEKRKKKRNTKRRVRESNVRCMIQKASKRSILPIPPFCTIYRPLPFYFNCTASNGSLCCLLCPFFHSLHIDRSIFFFSSHHQSHHPKDLMVWSSFLHICQCMCVYHRQSPSCSLS